MKYLTHFFVVLAGCIVGNRIAKLIEKKVQI